MAVDYREQYSPDQLEPFWPNEIARMVTVVLCTLAVTMAFVVLPVVLDYFGLGHLVHREEPANPRATPAHIRPEWYFLAVYQYLKLPPQEFLGISGKTIGVLSQIPFVLALLLVPFLFRRWSQQRMGWRHYFFVSLIIFNFLALTFWAIWRPPLLFSLVTALVLAIFYFMLVHELRTIRRVLYPQQRRRP